MGSVLPAELSADRDQPDRRRVDRRFAHVWADRITSLATSDGNLLLFNIMLTGGMNSNPVMFPNNRQLFRDHSGQTLFDMSSELPEVMRAAAVRQGYPAEAGARGMSMNADFRAVVSFLNVGTSVGHLLR